MADCELCGRSSDELYLIELESSRLSVCEECSSRGKFIGRVRLAPEKKQAIITPNAPEEEITPDYAEIIRSKREALGITQEDFAKKVSESLSLIKKIELGRIAPSKKTASKIERLLNVRLYSLAGKQSAEETRKKTPPLTLADIVKIKERK
ncbi:MAG: multiprotein-bridging factor 1 family protein [archaeon]